jgi:NAD(P)-dependent dehydrogenase (short-subunit alcohol dehydrogenase family)
VIAKTARSGPKTALITGGTDGLGRAAAILFAERGYRVFAAGRNHERITAIDQVARERKVSLEAIELDVCDNGSVERGVAEVERRAGPVDILVNNAGIAIAAAMEEISLADLHKQFETNIFGVMRMTQRVLPEMRRRRRGRIINMSSISGKIAVPITGAYAASKHALEAISDALRLELYPFGIYVVLIEPGYIPTSMNRNAAELSSVYATNALKSPYAGVYQGFMQSWEKTRNAAKDRPEDCARVILRAAEETPPRARYAVTKRAKVGIVARRVLSDRAFDKTLKNQLGLDELREKLREQSREHLPGAATAE